MAIRLSGMISGLDTDALIEELVSAYSKKKDKYVKEQKGLEYKQEAWKTLNTKVYSFYSGKLSSMRFSSNYASKSSSISDTTKAKVTASNTAVNGVQELKITSLAKTGYLTGAKLADEITGESKLSELGITGSARFNVTVDGKTQTIDLNADSTINDVVVGLKEAGLNANFDATNGRFFVSAKSSGAEADFSIMGNDAASNDALSKLGLYSVSAADISAYEDYINAVQNDADYMSNLAKNEYLNKLIDAKISVKKSDLTSKQAKISEYKKYDKFAALDDKAKTESMESIEKSIKEIEDWLASEEGQAADEATLKAKNETIATMQEELEKYKAIKDEVGSSEDADFKDKLKAYNEANESKIKEIEAEIKTINEEIEEINKVKEGDIAAKEAFLVDGFDYSSDDYNNALSKYETKYQTATEMVAKYEAYEQALANNDTALIAQYEAELGLAYSDTGAVRITGSDAVVYLNGARFESNTNTLNINGLTITATSVTKDDEVITITTTDDVDATYNKVKEFFKEYNELIKAMDTQYNAADAGEYEPLTDEEMEELSDKQIEKWEKKVKDAILRRDSTLGSLSSALKVAMQGSVEIDGVKYNLASFGIRTLGYFGAAENEKGMYHIDGDSEDTAVSGSADKLRAAIANDPETFAEFFSQFTTNIYNTLSGKMSASSVSSAYTVYNDKAMKQQYKDYKDKISDWEEKIEAMQEKYVKQFAAMEKALASLQSNQSQLSSLLGM